MRRRRQARPRTSEPAGRVLPIELFLDLAFVFTITQLTALIAHDPTVHGVVQALLVGLVLWWMFDGYAWLTNAVAPTTVPLRVLLLTAMAAYLVLALTVPRAFGRDGLAFGIAYLAVVVIHLLTFLQAERVSAAMAMKRIGALNLVSAVLIICAGFVHGWPDWLLWSLAIVVDLVSGLLGQRRGGFAIAAGHFAERHGLLLLIALGESVVAVAIGLEERPVDVSLALTIVLGLAVVAGLFWCYFADDEDAAEHFAGRAEHQRARLALTAFGSSHFLMIFGVVLLAAGIKGVVGDVARVASVPDALLVAGGVALFLAGNALYLMLLDVRTVRLRLAAVLLALLSAVLGETVAEAGQLLLLAVVLGALPFVETWLTRRFPTAVGA